MEGPTDIQVDDGSTFRIAAQDVCNDIGRVQEHCPVHYFEPVSASTLLVANLILSPPSASNEFPVHKKRLRI